MKSKRSKCMLTHGILQDRKIGCQLLAALSNNSTPNHVKRNIDVLCQLLNIIAETSDHRSLVAGSLRQHFILFPRLTIDTLFSMNICRTRETSGSWEGPCLDFFQRNLKELTVNHVESEIELSKQLWREIQKSVKDKYYKPSDMAFALKEISSFRLDFSKRPPDSSECDMIKEACEYLGALSVFALGQLLGMSSTDSVSKQEDGQDGSDPSSFAVVKASDAHKLLKHITTVYEGQFQHTDADASIKTLLCTLPQTISAFFCSLPEQMLVQTLRVFCNAASRDGDAFEIDKCDHLRNTIASTFIVSVNKR
jgi:hypothetical protein